MSLAGCSKWDLAMKRCFVPAIVVCSLAGSFDLHAQDDPPPAYVPLTLEQKYLFTLNKVTGQGGLAVVLLKSSVDQFRDMPRQWGVNADSFAVRAASRFGRSFVRQNLAFGIRALDGEDPRYFVSGHGGKWTRTKYAIVHSFAVRNDRGNLMPAYSLLISSYATPFIVNEWRPDRVSVARELGNGTGAIGFAVGSSIFQEFWPDMKKKLRRP